uniref:Uncharacterized protein n=1 Tax=Marseillevirus LCMAC101 TaxID=2506602 RepID=A0A481YTH5_9VIRU|nr:MAG: hypothetical protein LCMAC101_04210 [Marseillevirus LCMAC101]
MNKDEKSKSKDRSSLCIITEWAQTQKVNPLKSPIIWSCFDGYFSNRCICGLSVYQNGTSKTFYLNDEEMTLDNTKAKNILASKAIRSCPFLDMNTFGFVTKQEADECLNDIKIFATFTIDEKETWEIPHSHVLDNQMIIYIPNEYGIFDDDVKAPLGSLFNSIRPYQNTLDAFRKVAPEWFIDKYQQKNEEWESERKKKLR